MTITSTGSLSLSHCGLYLDFSFQQSCLTHRHILWQRVTMINIDGTMRECRDIQPEDDNMPEAQALAKKRSQDHIKAKRKQAGSCTVTNELPVEQVRSMFRGRLQSMMLQNRAQCRRLFRRWDPDNKGYVTSARFNGRTHTESDVGTCCCFCPPWMSDTSLPLCCSVRGVTHAS